jgi:hypothetical protein
MKKNNLKTPMTAEKINFLNQHQKPTTRREFISLGLTLGGAAVIAPTLGALLSSRAEAQSNSGNGTKKTNIPFIVLDLSGGAALFANFLVGNKNGPNDLLTSYSRMGWDPKKTALNNKYGIPMAGNGVSQLLVGLEQEASREALKNFKFSTLLHKGEIDTTVNQISSASLVSAAGSVGKYVSRSIGLRNSLSGGNSQYALNESKYKSMYLSNLAELENAVGLTNTIKSNLPPAAIHKLGQFVNRLSKVQSERFLNGQLTEEKLKYIDQKYQAATGQFGSLLDADPRKSDLFKKLYQIDESSLPASQPVLRAAVVKACLSKDTGPAVITIEGCDYHDGTSTTGDNKDREVGVELGRIIEAAYQMKTPVFIQIITDGGIYPAEGTRIWLGDSVDTCMSVMGYFNPLATPEYIKPHGQIGAYTNGQGVDRSTLIGENPFMAGYAVFANYLSVCGRAGEFKNYHNRLFSDAEHDSLLVF